MTRPSPRRRALPLMLSGAAALAALVGPAAIPSAAAPDPGGSRPAQAESPDPPIPDHAVGPATLAARGGHAPRHGGKDGRLDKAPVDQLPEQTRRRLQESKLDNPTTATRIASVTAAASPDVDPIDMRVLVLATKGDPNPDGVHAVPAGSWDWNLSTLTDGLDYVGTPYDTFRATTKELCVSGSWEMNYTVDSATTTCTSGKVVPWGTVTTDRLQENALHAYYQGVMQTNGTLSYVDPTGAFVSSALSAEEWSTLWTFEAAFGIRTVSANTYPTSDFGLTYVGEDGNASSATWTADGAAEFPYVNRAASLPVKGAWTYRAKVDPASTATVPLLEDAAGNALAVKHTVASQGNREVLALTFESAGYLTHGQVLGYGLVNWVTRGLFLGERHAYLDAQPDDLFISDSVWSGPYATCANTPDDPRLPEYRITGNDLNKVITWQKAKQASPTTKELSLEMPFNGEGTTDAYLAELGVTNDTLTPVARRNQALFKWVNHTWSHQNMDFLYVTDAVVSTANGVSTLTSTTFNFSNAWGHAVRGTGIPAGTTVVNVTSPSTVVLSKTASANGPVPNATVGTTKAQATSQINRNNNLATRFGLTNYSVKNIIQPDISGLKNPFFLEAADEAGVRYVISDTSRTGDPSQYGVNEGRYNALRPALLEVARYPVNLYFNASTPQEWLAQDNCLYPAGAPFGHVATYEQLLDRESTVMLRYLLQGHNRPLMFHQPNLRAYDGTRSVLGDLIDATLAKYNSLVTVPILSPTQDSLALKQISRQQYNDALRNGGLTGSIVPGTSVTLTSDKEVTVPVTGRLAGTAHPSESYAGQTITYVRLLPGESVTVPLQP